MQILAMLPQHTEKSSEISHNTQDYSWQEQQFSECLQAPYHAWVCCDEGQVIGYLVVLNAVDSLELLNIAVDPKHQQQGVGRLLMQQFERLAHELAINELWLEVRVSNTHAQQWYQQHGWQQQSVRKEYYPADKGREDAIIMGKQL